MHVRLVPPTCSSHLYYAAWYEYMCEESHAKIDFTFIDFKIKLCRI